MQQMTALIKQAFNMIVITSILSLIIQLKLTIHDCGQVINYEMYYKLIIVASRLHSQINFNFI